MNLIGLLISIIVSEIIVTPILWLVGRILVGKQKAKYTDAIWIVFLGIVIGTVIGSFVHGIVGALIMLIIWLALIKHFFDCGWLKALAISILAVIVFLIIIIVLAFVGISVLALAF
jgi:hypothetical protein